MSEVTVGSLAKIVGLPVDKLLKQLADAGMEFSGPDQVVSSTEKIKLLGFLRRSHGKTEKPAEAAAAPASYGGNVGPVGSPQEAHQLSYLTGQPATTATQLLLAPVVRGMTVTPDQGAAG